MEKTRSEQLKELQEFVKAHSEMPSGEVAELFNCSRQDVYHARHNAGVSKPITMTRKKRLKVVRKSTIDNKDARIEELEKQIDMLKIAPNVEVKYVATPDQVSAVAALEKHIESLDKQIIGYKAVINYLEHQLALAAQHGTSV